MNRCPKCEAIVPAKATHCSLCFAPLNATPVANMPVAVQAIRTSPPQAVPPVNRYAGQALPAGYNWKHVFICIAAGLWIVEGILLVLVAFVVETAFRPMGGGGLGFLPGIMGIIFVADGIGVVLGQNWAFEGMKFVCYMRVVFGLLSVLGNMGTLGMIYPLISIGLSVFLIWLLNHAHD